MVEEYYGVTLEGKDCSIVWDVVTNDEDYPRGQKVIIKQILLGAEAKEGEFNVVEVTTAKGSLKIPIAVLKAGETRAVNPDVEFYDTSTFKLIQGSGPVYIHGQNLKDEVPIDIDEDTDEEDEGEEEEEDGHPKKKMKLENNADGKNAKNKKK